MTLTLHIRTRFVIIICAICLTITVVYHVKHNKIFPYEYLKEVQSSYVNQQLQMRFDTMRSCIERKGEHGNDSSIPVDYSFFVAGHTYGPIKSDEVGMFGKFIYELHNVEQNPPDFLILTGDLVRTASLRSWGEVKKQLATLPYEYFIAPGNHDVGTGEHTARGDIFDLVFKLPRYSSFKKSGDLFILLNPNSHGWDIIGEQLEFLTNTLLENIGNENNVFIFSHQAIWGDNEIFEGDGRDSRLVYNSSAGKNKGKTNYWTSIAPLLESLISDVYFISGDFGAFPNGSELFCKKINNVTYIGSGMGGNRLDNFLKITVANSKVNIKVTNF